MHEPRPTASGEGDGGTGFTQTMNSARIGVTVAGNAVTLTGTVDTYKQKLTAVQAAQHVSRVHGVADALEIDLDAVH